MACPWGVGCTCPDSCSSSCQDPFPCPRERGERDLGTVGIGIEEEDKPSREPAQEQAKEETRGSSTSRVLKKLCKKLEEEKQQTERLNIKLRKVIRNRDRSYSEGSLGLERQTYLELQGRDKGYRREREGVGLGLEGALDLVEQAGVRKV